MFLFLWLREIQRLPEKAGILYLSSEPVRGIWLEMETSSLAAHTCPWDAHFSHILWNLWAKIKLPIKLQNLLGFLIDIWNFSKMFPCLLTLHRWVVVLGSTLDSLDLKSCCWTPQRLTYILSMEMFRLVFSTGSSETVKFS